MPKEKDYYKTLGVSKSATKEEIKSAYKKLAKQYHPDLNKDASAAEKFKEINEAAAVLGDDQKKSNYDRFGTQGEQFQQAGFSGFDFSDFMQESGGFGFDFDNIFETFFGGSRNQRRRQKGADLRYDMEIELEDAAFGATKTISVPRYEKCEKCNGTGAENPDDNVTCNECNGRGVATKTQRTPFGVFQSTSTCRKCRGSGKFIRNECTECDGQGSVKRTRKIDVKIPEGTDNGTNLRIQGGGEQGERGTLAGDLYIVLHVLPHKIFERHGNDIFLKIRIPFTIAALGGEIEVPTLKGKAKLKIPDGTQSNTVFKMKNQGIKDLHDHYTGDQLIEVIIDVPEKLSKKQRQLLEEFGKEDLKSGFFNKMF